MKMIIGLGNPGKEYEKTRHNIGFMVIDNYLSGKGITKMKTKFNGEYALENIDEEKVLFVKPLSYMNLSGTVVRKFMDFYKVKPKDILVISDDLDLPSGSFRLRSKGSSGGHNGLKNIEENIGTDVYKRLKIGISNNKEIDTKDYVLGKISKSDLEKIDKVINKTPDILDDYLTMTFTELMNKYNTKC
ncbi:MAG: aminoacyl-tRNA hydrolase [Bacilli bacterium]|nr:aminoacyl-tRNA hydrolase [Bacilli bacterium]